MEQVIDRFFEILDHGSRWGTLLGAVLAVIVIWRVLA